MGERFDAAALAGRIAGLPPLPQALAKVLLTLGRDDLSAGDSIALIEHDQALAARTLRLANSAFYGAPGRVRSIADAVRMLGLRTVACTLSAVALRSTLVGMQCAGFSFEAYWRHGLATALAARELAGCCGGVDPDEAFLAGLLHDTGQLVLAAYQPAEAASAIACAQVQDLDAAAAELQALGLTHADVGAMVARHWRFPESTIAAIAHHHRPPPPGRDERANLSGVVHVADAIVHALDVNADPHEAVPSLDAATWQALQLAGHEATRIFSCTEEGLVALSAV